LLNFSTFRILPASTQVANRELNAFEDDGKHQEDRISEQTSKAAS
jgi:hypothetical protein